MALPAVLSRRFETARKIVEVGVGNDFSVAAAWRDAIPGAEVVATDVARPKHEPPAGVRFVEDDVTRPRATVYEGASLVYGVRLPEELQRPAAAVARSVGAAFAVRPLKDELADVSDLFRRHLTMAAWHLYE